VPVRCAILPPVPVPYREPLFTRLAERGRITPRVIYLAEAQPGWDMRPDWFAARGGYDHELLRARQRRRPGRTPLMLPRGLGRALRRFGPDVVVSSEYGPATWRALAWCRARRRRLVVMTELTPWSDPMLSPLQLRVHRLLAPRMDGFVAFSSQGVARLARLGVDPARVEVSVQSADLGAFTAVARRRDPAARPVRVLSVGRLVPDKNLALLIEAFAECGFAEEEAFLEVVRAAARRQEVEALRTMEGMDLDDPDIMAGAWRP
jgi:glycosyltransferase involved in cell wall biosynthesis